MKRYVYKNKKGRRISSDVPLKDKDLVLVTMVRDGQMKSNKIHHT